MSWQNTVILCVLAICGTAVLIFAPTEVSLPVVSTVIVLLVLGNL